MTDPPEPDIVTYGAEVDRWSTGSDMVEDTVAVLGGYVSARIRGERAGRTGWQGTAAYEEDVRRIASLPIALYGARRLLSRDAVEQTLANWPRVDARVS